MNNVSVIGIGKLGLCFALTMERAGYNVMGVDMSQEYVDSVNNKTLSSNEEGVEQLIQFGPQKEQKHFVVCCTTMPQYCDTAQEKLQFYNYMVSYNPEFIAQGTILRDQLYPDMVLIGEASPYAGDILEDIYDRMTENNPEVHRMSRTEAELTKISLNCFLTTKIAYANMVGDIAKHIGARPQTVLNAVGGDSRVGHKNLKYGFGYGGPCFPRDNRALAIFANDHKLPALISSATDEMNAEHLEFQVEEFITSHDKTIPIVFDGVGVHDMQGDGSVVLYGGVTNAIVYGGVTYKASTTIIEESQQLAFAVKIAQVGFKVRIIDKLDVIKQVRHEYGELFEYQEEEVWETAEI